MKKYYISLEEYQTKTIEVEATTKEDAKIKVDMAYNSGLIKLTSEDTYRTEPFQVIDQDEVCNLELPFVRLKDLKILN